MNEIASTKLSHTVANKAKADAAGKEPPRDAKATPSEMTA